MEHFTTSFGLAIWTNECSDSEPGKRVFELLLYAQGADCKKVLSTSTNVPLQT
jgi:hypothetical protein